MTTIQKLATAAAALATLTVAAPAMAQSVEGTVTINGSVAGRCVFTTASQTIELGELAAATGLLDPAIVAAGTATLVGACNETASTMTVEADPLLLTPPGILPAGFDQRVDYTATATANAIPATDTSTSAGAGTPATVDIFSGNVVVTLSGATSPTSGILAAGDYTGLVTVTLAPAV